MEADALTMAMTTARDASDQSRSCPPPRSSSREIVVVFRLSISSTTYPWLFPHVGHGRNRDGTQIISDRSIMRVAVPLGRLFVIFTSAEVKAGCAGGPGSSLMV
jgi:hypothetical protein